jgi:phage baseplate assembly protein W
MAKGFGVVLPFARGKTGYFNQSFSVIDQAKSNLTNLILTKKGERVMVPTFGCEIHGRIFDSADETFVSDIQTDIESAVADWLPYIRITAINVSFEADVKRYHVQVLFSLINNPAVSDSIVVSIRG